MNDNILPVMTQIVLDAVMDPEYNKLPRYLLSRVSGMNSNMGNDIHDLFTNLFEGGSVDVNNVNIMHHTDNIYHIL